MLTQRLLDMNEVLGYFVHQFRDRHMPFDTDCTFRYLGGKLLKQRAYLLIWRALLLIGLIGLLLRSMMIGFRTFLRLPDKFSAIYSFIR
jgi:hypothetical protein